MGKVTDRIETLARPIVESRGLELYTVDFVKEGENWFLRVFIDKPEGELSLEDCEKVSKALSEILDRDDPIEQSYILEVSSPGLERPLRRIGDYDRYIDHLATIKLYAPLAGEKELTGTIIGREGEVIRLKKQGEEGVVEIPFEKIASGHLTVDF